MPTPTTRPAFEDALGPPLRGGRWACPIHGGSGPNFAVRAAGGAERGRCFTCGWRGDVFDLLAALEGVPLADALRKHGGVADSAPPRSRSRTGTRPPAPPTPRPPAAPAPPSDALEAVVADAERALRGPDGRAALEYLIDVRGLDERTIAENRIGHIPGRRGGWIDGPPKPDGTPSKLACDAIVFPWFDAPGGRPAALGMRRLGSRDELEALRAARYVSVGTRAGRLYPPRPAVVERGAVVVVEGELEALLLGGLLRGFADVHTLGNADDCGNPSKLNTADWFRLIAADPLVLAADADEPGDRAAARLAAWRTGGPTGGVWGAVRAQPPEPWKDWGDAFAGGVDVRTWFRLGLAALARAAVPPPGPRLEGDRATLPPGTPAPAAALAAADPAAFVAALATPPGADPLWGGRTLEDAYGGASVSVVVAEPPAERAGGLPRGG